MAWMGELIEDAEGDDGGPDVGVPSDRSRCLGASPPSQAELEFRKAYPLYGRFRASMRFKRKHANDPVTIEELFETEFGHLSNRFYMDHAGAAPVPRSVAEKALSEILTLGNPHSLNAAGKITAKRIRSARQLITRSIIGNATDYICVFTSGATAALKLVGECFPWSEDSQFVSALDSHDSAQGMAELAKAHGATVGNIDLHSQMRATPVTGARSGGAYHMFSFPGENNTTGVRHDVQRWTKAARDGLLGDGRSGEWYVCLDASKLLTSKRLVLDPEVSPDFIVMSFYKLVGAPTGVGALLVRRHILPLLTRWKIYRGGGSAIMADAFEARSIRESVPLETLIQKSDDAASLLEDGTLPFQQICLLTHSLNWFRSLGVKEIGGHAWSLRDYTATTLRGLTHCNGAPKCILYGPKDGCCADDVGPVVMFNLLKKSGELINPAKVGLAASENRIDLRWGSFCNRGGLKYALRSAHGEAHAELNDPCWRPSETSRTDGRLSGAVRASFGFASRFVDAQALIEFVARFVVDHTIDATQKTCVLADAGRREARHFEELGVVQSCESIEGSRKRKKIKRTNCSSLQRPTPAFQTPGHPDALPPCCGTYKERAAAGGRFPNVMSALRNSSLPGVCWYLHDQRHKHSVDEEFPHIVFGDQVQARTVLMVAASQGHAQLVSILIDILGANVNHASSSDGDTALHRAACNGRPEICKMLVVAGASTAARVREGPLAGWTASRIAEWKASGDRACHAKAANANYRPHGGGKFTEALAVLDAVESTCNRRIARVLARWWAWAAKQVSFLLAQMRLR